MSWRLRVVLVFAQSLIVDSKTDVLYTQLNANPQSKAVIDFMFNNKSSIFVITGADMDGDFVPNPLDFSRFVIPLPGMPLHLIRKSGEIRQTDMRSSPCRCVLPRLSIAPPPGTHAGRRIAH